MISPKRLLHLARKWKKVAAMGRKRLLSKTTHNSKSKRSESPLVASKGHFVMYTTDGWRYELPLAYLDSDIVRELFRTSEELFGFPSEEHITFPCDSILMEFIVAFLESQSSKFVERALLSSISFGLCSPSLLVLQGHKSQHAGF